MIELRQKIIVRRWTSGRTSSALLAGVTLVDKYRTSPSNFHTDQSTICFIAYICLVNHYEQISLKRRRSIERSSDGNITTWTTSTAEQKGVGVRSIHLPYHFFHSQYQKNKKEANYKPASAISPLPLHPMLCFSSSFPLLLARSSVHLSTLPHFASVPPLSPSSAQHGQVRWYIFDSSKTFEGRCRSFGEKMDKQKLEHRGQDLVINFFSRSRWQVVGAWQPNRLH